MASLDACVAIRIPEGVDEKSEEHMDRPLSLWSSTSRIAAAGALQVLASSRQSLPLVGFLVLALLHCPSAFSQIVSQSILPAPPERTAVDRNNVDVMTGAFSFSGSELSIGSGHYGLTMMRFYNSGTGWRDSFAGMVDVHTYGQSNTRSTTTAAWGNQTWVFNQGADTSRGGDGATLNAIFPFDSGYELTMRDGTVVTYSPLVPEYVPCSNDGTPCHSYYFATNVAYPNGLIVKPHYRIFLGSTTWRVRLQSVTNNAGYQIKFNYQSNTISDNSSTWGTWLTRTSATAVNNAVEYCDPNADVCSLSVSWPTVSYSNVIGTHTITDTLGRSTQYTYAPTSFKIKTAGSATDNIQYTLASAMEDTATGNLVWRVTSATRGSDTWSYAYWQDSPAYPHLRTTTSTDPQAKQTVFTSSEYAIDEWVPISVRDPLNRTTTFGYSCKNTNGLPYYFNSASYNVTSPEGNATIRACDSRGNVTSTTLQPKAGSGLTNIVTSADFPAACSSFNRKTCNQPTAAVDGRGAQTDYTYDATHGGVLTETLPAVNGVRPQRRYAYDQFYAYVLNASSVLVQASSPVWMPTKISECRTSASCTGGADEVVTSFEYGAVGTVNRLLVRGKVVTSGGVSLRTCYSYDQLGNQISVTTPRAGLSACP